MLHRAACGLVVPPPQPCALCQVLAGVTAADPLPASNPICPLSLPTHCFGNEAEPDPERL